MSRRGNNIQSKGQFSKGLTYQEDHVPAFLQKMRAQVNGGSTGHRRSVNEDDDESPHVVNRRSASPPSRGGREAVPERPREGKWAGGSDDEGGSKSGKKGKGEEEDDEWTQRYGGGDDAPQIVVLNEGKHLSAEEVKRAKEGNVAGELICLWSIVHINSAPLPLPSRTRRFVRYNSHPKQIPAFHHHRQAQKPAVIRRNGEAGRTAKVGQAVEKGKEEGKGEEESVEL
jgi:hypothetical protein